MRSLFTGMTIAGWLIFAFAIPGIVTSIFFVLGTGQPQSLIATVLVAAFGWLITRLDIKEKNWIKTLGILITGLAGSAILIICLLVTRSNSISLALWGTLPAAFITLGGILMTVLSPENRKPVRRQLARLSRS